MRFMSSSTTLNSSPLQSLPVSSSELRAPVAARGRFADYVNLTKPRLTLLAAVISAAGFFIGSSSQVQWGGFATAFFATFILSSGGMALNQYLERDTDALMHRTRQRPIPSGRMGSGRAFIAGIVLSLAGIIYL